MIYFYFGKSCSLTLINNVEISEAYSIIPIRENETKTMKYGQNTCGSNNEIQWNLSNPTHQGTREMCRIVQDVGIPRCCSSHQKYFGTKYFCRMSQDVGNLRCRIVQVPLYIYITRDKINKIFTQCKVNPKIPHPQSSIVLKSNNKL
jgi:hypothetical protein